MSPQSRGRKTHKPATRGPTPPRGDRPPEDSPRYTPPRIPSVRWRPTWHKVTGWVLVALGLAIVLINYVDYVDYSLLPGGHQEGYLFLGIAIAGSGGWWLGLFDRPS